MYRARLMVRFLVSSLHVWLTRKKNVRVNLTLFMSILDF